MSKSGPSAGLIALARLDARMVSSWGYRISSMDNYLAQTAAEFGLTSTPERIGTDLAEWLEVHEQITQKRAGDKPVPRVVKSTTAQSSGVRVPEQPALSTDSIPPAQAAIDAFRETVRLCKGAEERLQTLRRRRD